MSEQSLTLHVSESPVYTIENGKRQFIVTPVYRQSGENVYDILLRLICNDGDTISKTETA